MPHDLPPDRAPTVAPIGDFLPDAFTEAESRRGHLERVRGARTGFDRLDALIGGLRAGSLYVIAGRPGIGATPLAVALARGAASQPTEPADVLWVPLRDAPFIPTLAFVQAEASAAPPSDLPPRDAHEPWRAHVAAAERVHGLPISLLACANSDRGSIEGAVRAWAASASDRRVVVIDDADTLFSPRTPSTPTGRALLQLARDTQVALVLIGPVSRRVERRRASRHRPQLSDLALPSSVEHAADVVIFAYRASYYEARPRRADPRELELLILKNRFGPTSSERLTFDEEHRAVVPRRRDGL